MQRYNSLDLYERRRQSRLSVRQSLHKLSHFFGKYRPHPNLQHYMSLSDSDLSGTSISDSSSEKLAEAKSVSSETTDDKSIDTAIFSWVTTPGQIVSSQSRPLQPVVKPEKLLKLPRKSGLEFNRITFEFSNGTSYEWVRPRTIEDWPASIKKQIYRKTVVNQNKLMICGCSYCKTEAIVANQPSITQVSRAIRDEVLPMFYQENEFKVPMGHDCDHLVHKWLQAIGYNNYKHIHHLELPILSLDLAVETFKREYGLRPTKDSVVVEVIEYDDGGMGEAEWLVFAFETPGRMGSGFKTTSSVATSEVVETASSAAETQSVTDEGFWTTVTTPDPDTPSRATPISKTPPKLELRRLNGEEWGEARWSSAPKLEAHVLKRLASLGNEPRAPRKPLRPLLLRASAMSPCPSLLSDVDEGEGDDDAVCVEPELAELVARFSGMFASN